MPLIDQIENMIIGPKSFKGGRNVEWSQDMSLEEGGGGVRPDQLIALENFDLNSVGALIGRHGTNKLNTTAINSGGRIYSIYFYYKESTTTLYVMVQSGISVGTFNLTTGGWTSVGTPGSTPLRWLTWNDMAYAFNGTGIYKFDGTDWTQVQDGDADAPDSVDGTVLDDVLFTAWDTTSYKSRVPYSDEFDAEAWTATNFRRVRERDGQEIIGIDTLGNKILCRRTHSVLWLHGSSIYSFAEELITDEIGQVGRMTGSIKEGAMFFQSNRGVEYFDPASPRQFNNIVRDTCMGEILQISRTNRDAAVGIYHPKTDRYLLSFPDESTPITYVFYTNIPMITQDGNVWFPHSTYTGVTITAMAMNDEIGGEGKLYFGTDDGYILEADYQYTDTGDPIAGKWKWGYTDCGIENQVKNFARVFIPAQCRGSLQVMLDLDFKKTTKTRQTKSYSPADVLVWDSGVWGTHVWNREVLGTRKSRFTKCNGIRAAVEVNKTYSNKVEIHPITIEYFPKEKTRWP